MRNLAAEWEALKANDPREMPADFAPEMWADGNVRNLRYAAHGLTIQLGYVLDDTTRAAPELYDRDLKESAWQCAELARLGRADEARRIMGLSE